MKSAHQWIAWIDGSRRGFRVTLLRWLLTLASVVYGTVTSIRNLLYDYQILSIRRCTAPVISVGNLTVGGTGKTPVVAYLAEQLRRRGIRVTIVSRGYGAVAGAVNDEALELERLLPDVPHVQNPDRHTAAQMAVDELAAQVILLDDAFQHRRLHRDFEIVLLDATNPFGFEYLLPRGLLRESVRGLRRADLIVLTRADLVSRDELGKIRSRAEKIAGTCAWIETTHRSKGLLHWPDRLEPIEKLQGRKILIFSGIGNPKAFLQTVKNLGAEVVEELVFEDHCSYQRGDVERLQRWVEGVLPIQTIDFLVCTTKDLVKLRLDKLHGIEVVSLQIGLEIVSDAEPIDSLIDRVVEMIPEDNW
ncbi:MAG: Tetraacyldisaccharide 4-kinase [Planctomycetota bacterium]|jgi:tetraacyldisaccharide 4'-kinase